VKNIISCIYVGGVETSLNANTAGSWPANSASKSCFEMKCPTSKEISAAVKKAGKQDAIGIAKANPTMNLGRIQSALGGSLGSDL
jgi:hypothetical protein